jgi:bifunctional DNA primase/polymerase-like protein
VTTSEALTAALQAHGAGLCVVPPREDGSKAPLGQWKRYQAVRPDETLIRAWYELEGRRGIGLVCGAISGNLEMLEFEGKAVAAGLQRQFRERADQAGLGELLDRVLMGYTERTPSGGFHTLYRCESAVEGNLKLARRPATAEELAQDPQDRVKVLIETRGEGGYVITAPSNGGVHPLGNAWTMVAGGFGSIAILSAEEREALLDLARSFDEMPDGEVRPAPETPKLTDGRPGDDFNARASWPDILNPHGWRALFTASDGNQHWRRPGKSIGTSATISDRGEGVLYVFSTATAFEERHAYSKFGAYAILEHQGDFAAAAAELRRQGYGGQAEVSVRPQAQPAVAKEQIEPITRTDGWPVPPTDEAFYGLANEVVWTVDPYTEADPIAVLGQFLALFGVAVGSRPWFEVGATRHTPRIFVGIVGRSAKARKGDSWAPVERLLGDADESLKPRILGGFGSGEAMIHHVRDARYGEKDGQQVLVDSGEKDKRLMVLETELARLLVSVGREGSTISQIVRDAYDGRPLRNLVKSSPATATAHHIGVIGHTTAEELRGRLNEDQIRNGFANRFIWLAVRRSKKLASPPAFEGDHLDALVMRIRERKRDASMVSRMRRSAEAAELWEHWYEELSEDGRGILGVLTERAEAQVLRLSMLYALTDANDIIEAVHLRAARALWEYAERSVALIFGGTTGNVMADRILEVLADGSMTRKEILDDVFSRSISGETLHKALLLLEQRQLARREKVLSGPKGGRPAERWSKL